MGALVRAIASLVRGICVCICRGVEVVYVDVWMKREETNNDEWDEYVLLLKQEISQVKAMIKKAKRLGLISPELQRRLEEKTMTLEIVKKMK